MVKDLKSGDFKGFVKTGAEFADRVVKAEEDYNETLSSLYQEIENEKNTQLPLIQPEDDNLFESYYKLYSDLVK